MLNDSKEGSNEIRTWFDISKSTDSDLIDELDKSRISVYGFISRGGKNLISKIKLPISFASFQFLKWRETRGIRENRFWNNKSNTSPFCQSISTSCFKNLNQCAVKENWLENSLKSSRISSHINLKFNRVFGEREVNYKATRGVSVIIKPQLINVIILEILDRTLMIIVHRRRGVEIQTRISIPVFTVYPRRSSSSTPIYSNRGGGGKNNSTNFKSRYLFFPSPPSANNISPLELINFLRRGRPFDAIYFYVSQFILASPRDDRSIPR